MDKVKLTEMALVARVNRALKRKGLAIYKSKSPRSKKELGDWYIVSRDRLIGKNQNLLAVAQRLDVIKEFEVYEPKEPQSKIRLPKGPQYDA